MSNVGDILKEIKENYSNLEAGANFILDEFDTLGESRYAKKIIDDAEKSKENRQMKTEAECIKNICDELND